MYIFYGNKLDKAYFQQELVSGVVKYYQPITLDEAFRDETP